MCSCGATASLGLWRGGRVTLTAGMVQQRHTESLGKTEHAGMEEGLD